MPLFIYYSELNEFHSNCEALFAEVVEVITGVNFINFLTQIGLQKNGFLFFAVLKHVFYFLKPFFSVFYGFLFWIS